MSGSEPPVSLRPPPFEPPLQRFCRLARPAPHQKILDFKVLVEVRPVDAGASSDELPVGSFHRCPVSQAGVPRDWHGEDTAVHEVDDKGFLAESDTFRAN